MSLSGRIGIGPFGLGEADLLGLFKFFLDLDLLLGLYFDLFTGLFDSYVSFFASIETRADLRRIGDFPCAGSLMLPHYALSISDCGLYTLSYYSSSIISK